jgi:hypothetical protein
VAMSIGRGRVWARGACRSLVIAAAVGSALPGLAGTASAATGTISTVAGNGTSGYSGDGGTATSAELTDPQGVTVDHAGDVVLADTLNRRVRLVAAASCSSGCPFGLASMTKGHIYRIAGNGVQGFAGNGGLATAAELDLPEGLAIDARGDLLIADFGADVVWMVADASCASSCPYGLASIAKGHIYVVAGDGTPGYSGDGGAATSAMLGEPAGVAVDSSGDVLIADAGNSVVREVVDGLIYTVAGTGAVGSSGDGGPAPNAKLEEPFDVAVDPGGDVLVVDASANRVRLLAAASCSSDCAYGLASTTKGDIYTVAGNGSAGYSGDGSKATSAGIGQADGVGVDAAGNLLIADTTFNRVRLVADTSCASGCGYGLASMTKGDIYAVAGNGTAGYSGDGGAATSAELQNPAAVAFDPAGDLLIADTANNAVRLVIASVATPSLSISAPAAGTVGSAVAPSAIRASLASGPVPTGTITFKVFGPQPDAPSSCATGGTTIGSVSVAGNGPYSPSTGFTPARVGGYWWYASYSGDANNHPSSSNCGATMAETVVRPANPALSLSVPRTASSGARLAASAISASLSGGASASGRITFSVFGPQPRPPSSCTNGGRTVGTASVSGDGAHHPSAGLTLSGAGDYWWYASYGGDGNNAAAHSACGAVMPETIVSPARLTNLRVSPKKVSIAGRRAIKLTVSYALNVAATVTFTLRREIAGRRLSLPGKLVKSARAGQNRFIWNGRIGGRKLRPGRYELIATPSAGGRHQTVTFAVVD